MGHVGQFVRAEGHTQTRGGILMVWLCVLVLASCSVTEMLPCRVFFGIFCSVFVPVGFSVCCLFDLSVCYV